MKNLIVAAAVGLVLSLPFVAVVAHAEPVPCEDMLQDLRAATHDAKLSAADTARVGELEAKGVERCNADDDSRADAFFAEAMKIMGK